MLTAVQRFNFVSEVLPVILVGTLLNIIGRNACAYAQSYHLGLAPQLFLDMIGTSFSAVLLGPWWGAVVGIFSAMVNGNFYDNYFPFGVVNVCGGLAWGYVAAALGARERLAQGNPDRNGFLVCFLALFLSGALTCGVASFSVEAILYPPMQRPFVRGEYYESTRQWLRMFGPSFATDTQVLFWGEMSREFVDKTITLLIGLVCAMGYLVLMQEPRSTPLQRMRVDAVSILSFVGIYGVYLCFGRVFKPTIMFEGGDQPVEWLTYVPIIALLYFPLFLAISVFCLATLDQSSAYGRRVEAYRLRRKLLVAVYISDKPWEFLGKEIYSHLTTAKNLYGLIGGVLSWPLAKSVGIKVTDVGLLYAGGAICLVGYYFLQNYRLVTTCEIFYSNIKDLRHFFTLQRTFQKENSNSLLHRFAEHFGDALSPPFHDPSLSYVVVETSKVVAPKTGVQRFETPSTIVAAACPGNAVLTSSGRKLLEHLINNIRPEMICLLCSNARDPEFLPWIGESFRKGVQLHFMDWSLGEECLETLGRADRLTRLVAQTRVTIKAALATGTVPTEQLDRTAHMDLAARSLPGLAHVISRTPRGKLVLDLGCGRGRHTIYALLAGLKVVAIEKNAKPFADLVSYVKATGRSHSATQILNDYTQVDLQQFGYSNLVIITGVLQHANSLDDLRRQLAILHQVPIEPFGKIYIEMLFDMLFDGQNPTDNRINISQDEFDRELVQVFYEPEWKILRVFGPIRKKQNFREGPRSFYPPAVTVEATVVEYLILRCE